jgi:hypothetical protein
VNRHPSDWELWTEAMLGAAERLAGAGRT